MARKLGRYEIIEEIGKGGMGVVYRALDPAIGREVAIKTIFFSETASEANIAGLRARLKRESQAAGQLCHPNVVAVYDVGEEGDTTYIVMEFIAGRTLQQAIARDPNVRTVPEAFRILGECAGALDYAHGKGVVHRDVKPANIMLTAGGAVKIADFGVAKVLESDTVTQTAAVVGSPHYMAPEQLKSGTISGQTDQYALATLAYILLTGRCPFEADTMAGLLSKTLFEDPPPATSLNPALTAKVDEVLCKGLAKSASARYATCGAFVQALRQACESKPEETLLAPPSTIPPARMITVAAPAAQATPVVPRNQRWLALAVGALLAVALAAGGSYFYQRNRAEQIELTYWASIKDAKNPAFFQAYLQRYPGGQFADLARVDIDALKSVPPPPPTAPEATPKQAAKAASNAETPHSPPSTPAVTPPPSVAKSAKPPCPAELGQIPAGSFQDCVAYWTAEGYSPAAFTAYVEEGGTFLTGSFQTGVSRRITPLQTLSERQTTFDALSKQGYLPASTSSVATPAGPRFTTLWEPAQGRPYVSKGWLTREDLDLRMQQFRDDAIVDLGAIKIDGPARYRAVWLRGQPGDRIAQVDIAQPDVPERIRSLAKNGYRLSRLTAYGGDAGVQYAGLWIKDPGAWICYYRMTWTQLTQRDAEAHERGFHLHHITWFNGLFSGIWWK